MADVPLGMFLSGGLDSSAIAALMAGMIDRPLKTFSVAFKQRAFSELDYARQVSTAIGAEAHEIVIDDQDFFGALPRLIWHEDEPVAHPSSVPLYFVSDLAREACQGRPHRRRQRRAARRLRQISAGARELARRRSVWCGARSAPRLRRQLGRAAAARQVRPLRAAIVPGHAAHAGSDVFRQLRVDRPASGRRRCYRRHLRAIATDARAYGPSRAYFDKPNGRSTTLDRLLYTDMKTYLVELLMKQDQMSMAASLESRVPFLDHKLVEFAAALPARLKLRGFKTKWILREAVRGLLPAEILTRKKMGFPVPFGLWMRSGWQGVARDVLLDTRTRERGIIEPAAVEALLSAHVDGRQEGTDAIWSLMNLELWYRTFIDGEGVQSLSAPSASASAPSAPASARSAAASAQSATP